MSQQPIDSIVTYYLKMIDYSSSWFYFVCNTQPYSKGLSVFLHNTPVEQYANSDKPKDTTLGCVLYQLFSNRNNKIVREWATAEIAKLVTQPAEITNA